jgi:hypothetical protein
MGVWSSPAAGGPAPTWLFFSGTDLWRNGGSAYGGLLWSPNGLDREGFTFKLLIAGGTYRYLTGVADSVEVRGRYLMGSAMVGWRFKSEPAEITLLVGPMVQDHRLKPDDPGNRKRGRHFGALMSADLWYQPSPNMMAALNASLTTTADYSVRVALGWRLLDRVFIGPEGQVIGCDAYWQYRIGLHVTGLRTGDFEWSAAAGWMEDNDERSGVYGRVGLIVRR